MDACAASWPECRNQKKGGGKKGWTGTKHLRASECLGWNMSSIMELFVLRAGLLLEILHHPRQYPLGFALRYLRFFDKLREDNYHPRHGLPRKVQGFFNSNLIPACMHGAYI